MTLRKKIQDFFDLHEVAWEIFMIVLAVIFVIIGFLPDWFNFSESSLQNLLIADWTITCFFVLEFALRIGIAQSKKIYLKAHWLDLIALVPNVRWFRLARITRIFRLLRLARIVRGLNTLDQWEAVLARFGRMNGLQWIILAFTVIMLACSGLFYVYEHNINPAIQSYWDALYASFVTWATPGYGDITPMTNSGRICGVVLIVSGLITWGILIANLAAFLFNKKTNGKSGDPAIATIKDRLSNLDNLTKMELLALRASINALIDDSLNKQLMANTGDEKSTKKTTRSELGLT
jgi:voltage-gated potassium channel